jgi:two-component system, OmpR family, response regulator
MTTRPAEGAPGTRRPADQARQGATPAAGEPPGREARGADPATGRDGPCRVLVVDDHCNSADAVCALLGCLGYEARSAYSGEDAIADAREFLPDVVILDLDMNVLNGPETALCLTRDGLCGGVRLIAMTGRSDPSARRLCAEAGFHAFLKKPVTREALEAALRDEGP